jgi:hypothetical protein
VEERKQVRSRPQVQNPITGIPPVSEFCIFLTLKVYPMQKKEKKASNTQETIQKMTDAIKHLKQKAREIEDLSHKVWKPDNITHSLQKEGQLMDDAAFLKMEKRLEKHSMISSMYIGTKFIQQFTYFKMRFKPN